MMSILGWLVLLVVLVKAAIKGHQKTQQTLLSDWFSMSENRTENKVAKFAIILFGVICILTHKLVAGLLEMAYDARYQLDKTLGGLAYNTKYGSDRRANVVTTAAIASQSQSDGRNTGTTQAHA